MEEFSHVTTSWPGKDVDFVPTAPALVDRMLTMAGVGPGDHLVDLGSGDGRIVIAAAKRGAEATGIELNPDLICYAKKRAEESNVRCHFLEKDFSDVDWPYWSFATVVTCFLNPQLMRRLLPKFLALKPGTRIVSNTFVMWAADGVEYAETGTMFHTALMWRV